jgi:hypothetical protein
MDVEKFKKLRKNYEKQIGCGNSGKNRKGKKITSQTQSVWFDRKSIEELLAKTDKDKGGIKIYFGEYDEETIAEVSEGNDPEDYVGKLMVILGASNDNEETVESSRLINGGSICPPNCGRNND